MKDQPQELNKKPLKLTTFYEMMYGRRNNIQNIIYRFFFDISSAPRLLMEVFIRRNLGERYFSVEQCIFATFLLIYGPYLYFKEYNQTFKDTVTENWAWYLFAVAFAVMCFVRWREIKREPSVFDLGKFSLSAGEWLPFFDRIKPFGKHLTPRQIAIYCEPLIFLTAGIIFYKMHQILGFLLIFISIVYSISYMASYKMGDNFVLDKLDAIICNDNLYDTFVNRKKPSETKGFNPTMSGPSLFEIRDKLYNTFTDDEEDEAASVN